jgi:hypothetical protein
MKNEGKIPIPPPTASNFLSSPPTTGHIQPPPMHLHIALDLLCHPPHRYHAPLSAAATRSHQTPTLSIPPSCCVRPPPNCLALCPPPPSQSPCIVPFSVTHLSCVVCPILLAIMLAAPSCCIFRCQPALPFDCCVLALMPSPTSHRCPLPHQCCHCHC